MLTGGFLLEISMASLLLGWGVNLLMRHHSFNSRSAEFNWAILFQQIQTLIACGAAGPRIAYSVDIVRYKQGLKGLRAG